jgi:DNA polymerase III alpha subunit
MIWNDTFTKCAAHLETGRVVAITARLDKREEGVRLVASEVKPLRPQLPKASDALPMVLTLRRDFATEADLAELKAALEEFPGSRPVELHFVNGHGAKIRMRIAAQFFVSPSPRLQERVARWTTVTAEGF